MPSRSYFSFSLLISRLSLPVGRAIRPTAITPDTDYLKVNVWRLFFFFRRGQKKPRCWRFTVLVNMMTFKASQDKIRLQKIWWDKITYEEIIIQVMWRTDKKTTQRATGTVLSIQSNTTFTFIICGLTDRSSSGGRQDQQSAQYIGERTQTPTHRRMAYTCLLRLAANIQ